MGHPDPLSYTPRRMFFFLQLAKQRLARETHQQLSLQALAAQGQPRAIKEQLRELKKEAR